MNKLIDINGSYIQTQFTNNGTIWNLIGTECIPHEVMTFKLSKSEFREHILVTTRDFFKSDKGEHKDYMRHTVDVKFNQGIIKLINQKKPSNTK